MVLYLTCSWRLVFTMYTRLLEILQQQNRDNYQLYADDTHLCISLDPENELHLSYFFKNLERCIADIRMWMTPNLLRFNNNKTTVICYMFGICDKSFKDQHYRWVHLRLPLMGQ